MKPVESPEIVHIAIVPPVHVEDHLIKEVSDIINHDLYSTRLLLAGKSPRIIAHYQTLAAAESANRRLQSLGLVVILSRDSDLRKAHSPVFSARFMIFADGEFMFQDQKGITRTIKTEDIFLLLKGTRNIYSEKKITKMKKELNLPATLLTGGIPIRRKVEEKTVETSIQTELFMRLYHPKSPEPDIEITQHSFDYSCLGANMSATTFINFNMLIVKIKQLCRRSIFDDTLVESHSLGISSPLSWDNDEVRCKLVYLFREAAITP